MPFRSVSSLLLSLLTIVNKGLSLMIVNEWSLLTIVNKGSSLTIVKGSDRQSEVVELSMQYCAQIL